MREVTMAGTLPDPIVGVEEAPGYMLLIHTQGKDYAYDLMRGGIRDA